MLASKKNFWNLSSILDLIFVNSYTCSKGSSRTPLEIVCIVINIIGHVIKLQYLEKLE